MNTAVTYLTYNFKTATTATNTELQNQLTNYQDMYEAMKQAVEDGAPGITQAQVDAMAKMVAAAENELKNFPDDVGVVGQTASRSFVAGINSGRNSASEAGKNIGDSTSEGMKRAGEQAGKNGVPVKVAAKENGKEQENNGAEKPVRKPYYGKKGRR